VILFYQPEIPDGVLHLDEEESRHCVKVLRKNSGDLIRVTDGKGAFYDVLITRADPRQCTFSIKEKYSEPVRDHHIHIAISPTKNADRIEWFVEKSVELGVDEITLMDCDNTERSHIKAARLKKVAISAMKQSLKAILPIVNDVTPFSEVLKFKKESGFIAYVDSSNPLHLKQAASGFKKNALVLIGPEGDFSKEELSLAQNAGFKKVSLGNSRLRTETAGIAACHILNLVQE
jgi:16S rRNA (uracil1498-N3)-methyltransferase